MGELVLLVSTQDLARQRARVTWARVTMISSIVTAGVCVAGALTAPGWWTLIAAASWIFIAFNSAAKLVFRRRELDRMEDGYLPRAITRR